ncbi:MAG: 16S rRNA (uracil(1498)-N(3))-methyltransferase [Oscillospiraceae bacterium]|jgi:16S rRNA (uracil1498-N3)-methyltransferase|nr:16S rRNA (uracil(1498)-N(3))-methyltransferase [Oscillospiraceae bacterium]
MHRFFTDGELIVGATVALDSDESRHALRVLRMSAGDAIHLLDGRGASALAFILHKATREHCNVNITEAAHGCAYAKVTQLLPSNEPQAFVTLYQGLCKGGKLDLIVQKCTELGIGRIVPVQFMRSDARLSSEENRAARLTRIAREAVKQCGRSRVPDIAQAVMFSAMLKELAQPCGLSVVLWENEKNTGVASVLQKGVGRVSIIVGPEGGIDETEVRALTESGAVCATLGKRILRTETAAIAATTVVMYALGEL